jgi:hypothetical protein
LGSIMSSRPVWFETVSKNKTRNNHTPQKKKKTNPPLHPQITTISCLIHFPSLFCEGSDYSVRWPGDMLLGFVTEHVEGKSMSNSIITTQWKLKLRERVFDSQ